MRCRGDGVAGVPPLEPGEPDVLGGEQVGQQGQGLGVGGGNGPHGIDHPSVGPGHVLEQPFQVGVHPDPSVADDTWSPSGEPAGGR